MDDHLTYKIEEVCYDELMKFFASRFEDTIVIVKKAFETLGEFINESLSDVLERLHCYLLDEEEQFQLEQKKKYIKTN